MVAAPENTSAAFDAALSHPIDGIEFDVQMTRDHVLVLYHDRNLMKIAGTDKTIADCELAELEGLDWGGWHAAAYEGEPLLTLHNALSNYVEKTRLLIEIKHDQANRRADLMHRFTRLLESDVPKTRADNVFILSFDPEILRMTATQPWRLVLNMETPAPIDALDLAGDLYACCASIDRLDRKIVTSWRKAGKAVMTYSCNTPAEVDRAREFGCDVIMTDRPEWIFQYLNTGSDR